MIARRMRQALATTASVFLVEFTAATAVAFGIVDRVERATGADDDPFRALIGLVEQGSHRPSQPLLAAFAIAAGILCAYALVEPWLTNTFVRAHADAQPRSEPLPFRRYAALVGARVLLACGVAITLGFLGAFLVLVHLATRSLADPRIHDLLLLALASAPLLATPTVMVLLDLATLRIAIGQPRPLEAIGDAIRRLDAPVSIARAGLLVLGLATLSCEGWLLPGIDHRLGYAFAAGLLAIRLFARSAFVAWLTERETRRVD